MSKHVYHLLTAYVHQQLSGAQRVYVARHVQRCAPCREALAREERLARDLQSTMPLIGQPAQGRLGRLWPTIWAEIKVPRPDKGFRLPSYGMALALTLVCAIVVSVFFNSPTYATAAPLPPVPAEIQATATPIFTEQPNLARTQESTQPIASRTAFAPTHPNQPILPPMPSPAPYAGGDFRGS
jgi:hypothetical protein